MIMPAVLILAVCLQISPGNQVEVVQVVRPSEIGADGHADEAAVIRWFGDCRSVWMARHGLSRAALKEQEYLAAVARIEVTYRANCREDDVVLVQTTLDRIGDTRLDRGGVTTWTLRQVAYRDGVLAAEATVTMTALDRVTRKPRPVPAAIMALHSP